MQEASEALALSLLRHQGRATMLRLLIILLLVTGVTTGCSLGSSDNQSDVADAPAAGEEVVEEVEEIIGGDEDVFEVVEEDGAFDEGSEVIEESGLPEEITESIPEVPAPAKEEAMPEIPQMAEMPQESSGMSDEMPKVPEVTMPETEEPYGEETMSGETPIEEAPAEKVVRSYVPVKKVAESPWLKNGYNANTVYIVRPGDTMDGISEKIYGNAGRADELYEINPNLRRSMRVGDKVYYNSPQRPNDKATMLTFYEDNNVPSQMYVAQAGDNIRMVSQDLLGDERSWMEIWATNPGVTSKWELSEGTELRYWPTNVAVGGPVAPDDSMMEAEMPVEVPADEPVLAESMDSPDVMPEAEMPAEMNAQKETDLPPPAPPMPMGTPQDVADLNNMGEAAGTVEPPPPPPPIEPMGTPSLSEEALAPPPPPPPPKAKRRKKRKADKSSEGGLQAFLSDENNLMLIGGLLLVVVAGALIIIRKKRLSSRINLSETQV